MVGKTLLGKYRIDKRIGRGAFGDVYQGFDESLKRRVAVKVLRGDATEAGIRRRFQREPMMMARLRHDNIVTVYDSGTEDGCEFIVMEFVDGVSLLERLEAGGVTLDEVLRWFLQVARGMRCAHEAGLIHRDLTLKNIMVTRDGQARILDFGLARSQTGSMQSSTGALVGTPAYLSPEQARGDAVDGRTDIFAFGVCLYRAVNGRFPHDAEHPAALLYQLINERPLPCEPEIPPSLRDVVMRCLEKRPEHRYPTFADVERDVEEILAEMEGRETSSVVQPWAGRGMAQRGSRRNPYLNRVMIKDPADFYGRKKEISRIYARLDAPRPQSIAIVGERRIGKSSLLNYLYHRANRRRYMTNHRDAIFVYMDFQRGGDLGVEKFIDVLFAMFDYEQRREFGAGDRPRTLNALREEVEKLNEAGKRVIVLMDEFEAVTTNPQFDMQFFSFLRFLANNYRVAYVTSSYRELQEMCHHKDIADSPFFNIFSNMPLRPFSEAEARELITVPSAREGLPLERYADRILQMGGRFPFFLQIACAHTFEYLVEHEGGEPDWAEIEGAFRAEAEPHFHFIWERLDPPARKNLLRAARGKPAGPKYRHVSDELKRRGYLVNSDGGTSAVFSEAFREFVTRADEGSGRRRWLWRDVFRRGG